jgi:hypothetical protein
MGFPFSDSLNGFAKQVVWFMPADEALADTGYFLAHLMAKSTDDAYEHLRRRFPQFTDEDFVQALRNAPPGLFLYEDEWNTWNEKFGLIPPLPFPRKYA